jgi:hypothetical protein
MPNKKAHFGQRSYYDLSVIKDKIAKSQVTINTNARDSAYNDFNWDTADILDVYNKLKPRHFFNSNQSYLKLLVWVDAYKIHVNEEDVYTHFYVNDEGFLVINSFHKDRNQLGEVK